MLFLRGYTLKRNVVKAGETPQNKDVEAQAPAGDLPAENAVEDRAERDEEATLESRRSAEKDVEKTSQA